MDRDEARHLLRRTGGDTRRASVDVLADLDRHAAVDHILDFGANGMWSPPPIDADQPAEYVNTLAADWVDRWATAPRPFEEKLLLFFHSHFAVHRDRIQHPEQMREYLAVLRAGLSGDYRTLVRAVSLSPAMLLYLDNYRNRPGRPNENFARESLELHLLGTGAYDESDVRESARAWTGHTLDADDRVYRFDPAQHDSGEKTILGVRRRWDGPEVIDHVLTDPALRVRAARHLATRLWRFMTATEPPGSVVRDLGAVFVDSGLQIRALVRALLLSEEFLTGLGRTLIPRPPMEYAADLHRVTGLRSVDTNPQWHLRQMGQVPFYPPTPAGWDNARAFISASAFLTRAGFVRGLAWKAESDTGFLEWVRDRSPVDAVQSSLEAYGLDSATPSTRRALEDLVVRERAVRGWSERVNLITTVALSPDAQVG